MYRKIMVPVDLAHLSQNARAIDTAADLARHYGASIAFVSVTAETPTAIAHNPVEFSNTLNAFARAEETRLGVETSARAYAATDPTIDVDRTLIEAIDDTGADLVVMASHKPGVADYFWSAHGARLATNTAISVFLVR